MSHTCLKNLFSVTFFTIYKYGLLLYLQIRLFTLLTVLVQLLIINNLQNDTATFFFTIYNTGTENTNKFT